MARNGISRSQSISRKQQLSETALRNLADDIIVQAKKCGASAVEVDACVGYGLSVNVRKSAVETIEYSNGKTVGVTVYFGYRTGSAISADVNPKAIRAMVNKACHIARFTNKDPYVGLAEKELLAFDYPDLDLFYPWNINIDKAITLSKELEDYAYATSKLIKNSEGAGINIADTLGIYANTHGFAGIMKKTKHVVGIGCIAAANGEMQRDYYFTVARDPKDLEPINVVANKAATRAVNRLYARKIATQICPVIFLSEITSGLINNFLAAISGSNLYNQSSFLLNSLNTQVCAKQISIEENPLISKALGSSAFDCQGVKLSRSDIVVNGILQRYVLDTYYARKLHLQTTGNSGGVHNILVNHSNLTFAGLLRKMGKGLLVTELMGDGVNMVTGDYSRGVFGYWVENGEIQYPVTGITIAGNLRDMFLNIVAIADDADPRGSTFVGSMLIDSMVIAGE